MPNNYVLLERIELNASAASVSFQNIPQSGYTDLKIVVSARSSYSSGEGILMQFNGSSGANYFYRQLYGAGSSAGSYAPGSGQTSCLVGTMGGTNFTASTFDSVEIYVPNYTSSNNKSFSVDSVAENNSATVNQIDLLACLWTQTAAINSISLFSYNSASFVQYSTFSLYGLAAVGTTPVIAPKASGGNITTDGTYWIHTFNTTGAFVPQTGLSCDYLVIAGGGGGGSQIGAGGGAGGYLTGNTSVSATSYTITVGAGGAGATNTSGASGTNGLNSVFSAVTSTGGGGGAYANGSSPTHNGLNGGSGGGGSWIYPTTFGAGGTGTVGQGNDGGSGYIDATGNTGAAGGGGGAGGTGGIAIASLGGNGGTGSFSSITGSSVGRAGGGGGGQNSGGTAGTATSGGGAGGRGIAGTAGTTNTGGGGGGGGNAQVGGNGGSGIVIIRYAI